MGPSPETQLLLGDRVVGSAGPLDAALPGHIGGGRMIGGLLLCWCLRGWRRRER